MQLVAPVVQGEFLVPILIQPESRMQHKWDSQTRKGSWLFQSSSSPKAGCNLTCQIVGRSSRGVPILIQPESRMQPQTIDTERSSSCSNPHPARKPDATCGGCTLLLDGRSVPILIQPESRMQPGVSCAPTGVASVPILIQPESRMQPHHAQVVWYS